MAKKRNRAERRGTRSYPQEERIFSLLFMPQMEAQGGCFIPLEDFLRIQKKYLALFRRQRREAIRKREKILKLKRNLNAVTGLVKI